jgi:hypothetical protein
VIVGVLVGSSVGVDEGVGVNVSVGCKVCVAVAGIGVLDVWEKGCDVETACVKFGFSQPEIEKITAILATIRILFSSI